MGNNFDKKIFRLKAQLTAAIFLLIVILISGFFIFGPDFSQIAQALNPTDYNKAAGSQLTVDDWNRLDADFVAKSGDTMTGPLTLPGAPTANNQAATKQYVDGKITNSSAGSKVYCGVSPAGGWSNYGTDGQSVMTVVNTSAAGFTTNNVMYISRLSGTNSGPTIGMNSLYSISANSFELHIIYVGWPQAGGTGIFPGITGAQVNSWGWQVNWCGIGQ